MYLGSSSYRSLAPLLQQFFFAGLYHHFLPKRKRLCFRTLMLDVNNPPGVESHGGKEPRTRVKVESLPITGGV
jgi:hypothetical protein